DPVSATAVSPANYRARRSSPRRSSSRGCRPSCGPAASRRSSRSFIANDARSASSILPRGSSRRSRRLRKGPRGCGAPARGCGVWLAATHRWSEIPRASLVSGVLVVLVVVGPWFVAKYVRHGSVFTDELIFNDMFNRAFGHVHDTNAGADTSFVYYVQQLGYGL